MNIFYKICEMSATVVEVAILLEFINKWLGSKFQGKRNIIQIIGAFLIISFYMLAAEPLFSDFSAIYNIGGIIIYVVYAVIFTKSDLIYRIIVPVISIMTVLFINIISSIIVTYTLPLNPNDLLETRNSLRIVMLFITKITFFLLTRIFLRKTKPKTVILNKQELTAVSAVFVVSVIILGFGGELYYGYGENNLLDKFMLVLLSGLVVVDITVFILFYYIARKNRDKMRFSIMEMQFEEQKKSYNTIQTVYHNLQIIQHDMKNELLCLYNLIDSNKTDEAKQHITNLSKNKLDKFHEYIKTGNELIDAIINVKLNFAREKNIDVLCNINTDFNGFDVDDIICLFSNAIDNAIEACIKQKERKITVNITNKRNYLSLSVANIINSSVLKHNSKLKTTKKDFIHHGLGTQSMRNITEKYDGMIEFYEKDNMFVVDIMIKSFENIPNTK